MWAEVVRYWPLFLALNTVLFNEYLIFHLKIGLTCDWPCSPDGSCVRDALRLFMIADTHLLGVYRGHWLDKLKREWQMYRSYQSALRLGPDAVFFLGDIMDEGQWTNKALFDQYADRFFQLFGTSDESGPAVHVVAGNHDLGFHDAFSSKRLDWFSSRFNKSTVDTVVIKGQPFVLLNSMSLHGDGCRLCHSAEMAVERLSSLLRCSRNESCHDHDDEIDPSSPFRPYRQPILLQHFPLFRKDESDCVRDDDFDWTAAKREVAYKDRWDALSEKASRSLLQKLEPRAVFNGHAHRGCKKRWTRPVELWEYTVNSFSWRNGDRPTFLMVTVTEKEVMVSTCHLPHESTTVTLYVVSGAVILIWALFHSARFVRSRLFPSQYGTVFTDGSTRGGSVPPKPDKAD